MAKPKKKEDTTPQVCKDCVRWEKFGKGCYYFWEGKKQCTMWTTDWEEAAQQQQFPF